MPLWLPEAAARVHPLAIDAMLVAAGLASSLTQARRDIAAGAVCLNNEKLIPPEPGFLPVAYDPGQPGLYEWIWDALREGAAGGQVRADPGTGFASRADRPRGDLAQQEPAS